MSDLLEKVSETYVSNLMEEYKTLVGLSEMTDTQAERYEFILSIAEENEVVDFAINEVDHILGHEMESLDMKVIGNTQALLRERKGTKIGKCSGMSVCRHRDFSSVDSGVLV